MGNGNSCPGDPGKMARLCLIYECKILGAPVCCADCGLGCKDRCKNSPKQCNCAGEFISIANAERKMKSKRVINNRLTAAKMKRLIKLLDEQKLPQKEIAKKLKLSTTFVSEYWREISNGERYKCKPGGAKDGK